jgi:hypothetical protein
VPDIFSYELIQALSLEGCALCRVLEADDERWMVSFWREGRQGAAARARFFEAGGFCRDHAWLLHRIASDAGTGAAIADLYGQLLSRDLRSMENLAGGLRGQRRMPVLPRGQRCPACVFRGEALERKAHFLVEALDERQVCDAYRRSSGLCLSHFVRAFGEAVAADADDIAGVLLSDFRERLARRSELLEYDRRRDSRYALAPKGSEQRSWTEVIRRYVGGVAR